MKKLQNKMSVVDNSQGNNIINIGSVDNCGTMDRMELLLGRLEQVRNEAARKQSLRASLLREKFKQISAEIMSNKKNGRDPLTMLPEEIWTMILDYVKDDNDIANCAKTCTLFHRILDGGNSNWLFKKVFPFLYNYLSKEMTSKCRTVCKRWRFTVDNFLESYYTIDDVCYDDVVDLEKCLEKPKRAFKKFEFEYEFNVPGLDDDEPRFDRFDCIRDEMSLHLGNPFVGRSVTLFTDWGGHEFSVDFRRFLNQFGRFIWYFDFSSQRNNSFYEPQEIYNCCIAILLKCRELRGLHLTISSECRGYVHLDKCENESARSLPNHSFLESMSVSMGYPFYSEYQDRLLKKYCTQLKFVDVEFWNRNLYQNFQWTNLRALRIGKQHSDLLDNLTQLNAPNLRAINLRIDGNEPQFEKLMRLVHHFPNLDRLELRLPETFCGVSDEEIINISPELACCATVSTLKISMVNPDISYNFLICFPNLDELILRHGFNALYEFEGITEENEVEGNQNIEDEVYDGAEQDNSLDAGVHEANGTVDDDDVGNCAGRQEHRISDTEMSDIALIADEENEWCKIYESSSDEEEFYSGGSAMNEDGQLDANFSQKSKTPVSEPKLRNDVIQIQVAVSEKKFRRKSITQVHNSNIWEVLTKLETVFVYRTDVHLFKDKRKVYSRKEYDMRKMNHIDMLTLHWQLAKKDAAYQKNLKSSMLRDLHKKQITKLNKLKQNATAGKVKDLVVTDAFEKVFPLISNHLNRKETLSCRGVCKQWCSGVDSFLENYYTVQTSSGTGMGKIFSHTSKKFDFVYKFGFPYTSGASTTSSRHDNLWAQIELHGRNPFIGRTVEIQLDSNEGSAKSLRRFLEQVGGFIWHVKLSASNINEPVGILSSEYYPACYVILQLCPNIRSLCLEHEPASDWPLWEERSKELQIQLKALPYFESLIVHNLKDFQNRILEKYCSQLKRIHFYKWHGYPLRSFQWKKLQDLVVLDKFGAGEYDMTGLHAPELINLVIQLSRQDDPELQRLLRIVCNFIQLQHVEIRFSKQFAGFQLKEILRMPPGFTSSNSLESMEIIISNNSNFSFDFLIYFPYLKNLCIRIEPPVVEHDSSSKEINIEDMSIVGEIKKLKSDKKALQTNLVQLSQYIWQEEINAISGGATSSNIWIILPFLQTLKVCLGSCTINGEGSNEKVYKKQYSP